MQWMWLQTLEKRQFSKGHISFFMNFLKPSLDNCSSLIWYDLCFSENKQNYRTEKFVFLILILCDDSDIHIPRDWLQSTFAFIPKKHNSKYCKGYRLISLMSHALKALRKIIQTRIYRKCRETQ